MRRVYVPLEELLPSSQNSVFKLTMLAAKRAVEISDGAKLHIPRVSEKAIDNAVHEILEKKIRVK